MDVLMLSTAIAALAVAMLVLALAVMVCTIVLRKSDAGPEPDEVIDPTACVLAFGPEPEADPYSDAESHEGSFTLPLPPGFGMSTAQLC